LTFVDEAQNVRIIIS